jgi:hypothetical protein
MSTTFSPNGSARYSQADEQDWAAWLEYAADQERWPREQRTPCANPDCSALCTALFCSERCREAIEGPDHDDALECEEQTPTAETYSSTRGNLGIVDASESMRLPEAPASANVFVTLKGRQVQLTLRDTCETRLLQRLAVVLDQFPLEPSAQASATQASTPPPQTPVCRWHGAMKESIKAPGTWYCPNKMGDGTYCHERWPAKDGGRR